MSPGPDSESGHRLLLIDPGCRPYRKRLSLSFKEWNIIPELDPQKATDIFFHQDIDLVLLGHGPDAPSLSLLNFFKSVKPSIPIIIVSDVSSEELILSSFRQGAWDFFKKPFLMREMRMSVDAALSTRKRPPPQRKTSRISRAIGYISKNFFTQLRLSQIARESAMSLSCFERTFKKEMGTTYAKFLNRFRISRAAKMLLEEDRSISEIAYACGFNNPYHFTRMFNRIMAVSPRAYRKSVREAFSTISPLTEAKKIKK
jgi:AraC-like DNA-binding protein